MDKGLIHIYYGEGKGKTTSAIGIGIRALGHELKVCMIQFLKHRSSGEYKILKDINTSFKIICSEKQHDFYWNSNESERLEIKQEELRKLDIASRILTENSFDILILDEILGIVENKIISEEMLINLLNKKIPSLEIVLTGRHVSENIIKLADYVSKIIKEKHPFDKGIAAREGIEY